MRCIWLDEAGCRLPDRGVAFRGSFTEHDTPGLRVRNGGYGAVWGDCGRHLPFRMTNPGVTPGEASGYVRGGASGRGVRRERRTYVTGGTARRAARLR